MTDGEKKPNRPAREARLRALLMGGLAVTGLAAMTSNVSATTAPTPTPATQVTAPTSAPHMTTLAASTMSAPKPSQAKTPAPVANTQPPPAPLAAQTGVFVQPKTYEVIVGAGKSQVLQLPTTYSDLMVADPKIADVMPLTDHSVYVIGNAVGATGLTIYGPGRRLIAAVNVVVSVDIESFKARLHDILPEERDVAARAANDTIILSGTVSSAAALEQIMTLANSYAPSKVVNMMAVEGVQQVMLSVRFVEMQRTAAKDLSFNLQSSGWNHGNINTGIPLSTAFGSLAATFHIGNTDLTATLDALETKGVVKTLAEPNLTTMSGETASFLAGGEFPIPISSSAPGVGGIQTISIEFKQFGIALAFTPTILKDGLINLVVNPEVSSIDPTVSVSTAGITVPGLKVRRAHATVELRDGESFTVAGLLADNYTNTVSQFPLVGDIPVLGSLFRSPGYQRNQTELVIVVTPHLVVPRRGYIATPADHFVPPSDYELFLMGTLSGTGEHVAPEDRVLMSTDPTKGGVDGPHGHVLY